jgi:NADH:ubiquinone oxidoreductase subunit K
MTLTLAHYLVLSAALFTIGIAGVIARRNAIAIFMSLELVFNAVNINLVAVSRFLPQPEIFGQVFTLFVIAVTAAESVLGLAIILAIYKIRVSVNADEYVSLKQ